MRRAQASTSSFRGAERADGHWLSRAVYNRARRLDNLGLRLLDAGVVAVAWLLAYVAGYEGHLASEVLDQPWIYFAVPIAVQLLANQVAGLYGPVWRYASVEEGARVIAAVALGVATSALALAGIAAVTDAELPVFTTPPVAAMLILLGCGGIRFQARLFAIERLRTRDAERTRTVIVGAGASGAALAHELKSKEDFELVGFVDDAAKLRGRSVRGLRVLGTTDELAQIADAHDVGRVIIALPNSPRERTQQIVEKALQTNTQVKVLAPPTDRLSGPLVRSLRDIDLADLLGREHAPVDPCEIAGYLEDAVVLVTGAGGSIGSEIARQVARFGPARLLLLDRDESLLHDALVGELAHAEPVLTDIRDQARVRAIFQDCKPDVVFHAAAHKHVPMLEQHPVEAVSTNLLGTWWLAATAAAHGCQRFVHVSTDKAANPCSIMGATKRAAELVVFEVGAVSGLPIAAVRFGNVLGSRGSVVPTFLRQILDGGPVTVTDPDMTRYFMTIPEAVSLVLQAGAMVDEGRVFLLDMGDPVSILDLARQMIRLAGLRPDEDIAIEITGRRPGERVHEQLHDNAEHVVPTSHPSIWGLTPATRPDAATLFFFLELLERKCSDADRNGVANVLAQLLRQNGIDCHLGDDAGLVEIPAAALGSNGATRLVAAVGGNGHHGGNGHGGGNGHADTGSNGTNGGSTTRGRRPRTTKKPVVLGGLPTFSPGLPFARPPRLPLERVARRLEPSYDSGMLTNGPLVAELEERIASRLGVRDVVAVSSCTSGLMLAVQALADDRPGAVVLPSFTFAATSHAVSWNSRTPRFVDCDASTFQIDMRGAEAELDGASVLLATHVFGAPCRPDEVVALARSRGVPVLFDAAHALGATSHGHPIGGFGAAEVFSLTPTKVLVAGEGGLVATNDLALAEVLRIGRDYGNPGNYDSRFAGLNARMSEFHAAMALESLEMLDELLERRVRIAETYATLLAGVPGVSMQVIDALDVSTYKDFTVRVDRDGLGIDRDQLVRVLTAEGIDTRCYFDPPVHRQHAYRNLEPVELPVTDALAASVVSLPIYPDMTDEQVEHVAAAVLSAHEYADELAGAIDAAEPSNRLLELS